MTSTELIVEGMHCASCAKAIEKGLLRQEGVQQAELTFATETLKVSYVKDVISLKEIQEQVKKVGFKAVPESEIKSREEAHVRHMRMRRRRLLFNWVVGAPVFAMIITLYLFPHFELLPFLPNGNAWFEALFATPVVLYGGWIYYVGAYQAIRYAHTATTDVLISIGSLSAYLYSVVALFAPGHAATYFDTATIVVTFIATGSYLKIKATYRSSEAIRSLVSLQPRFARRVQDGEEREVPIDAIGVGDLVRVRPGERVTVDAVVQEGDSYVEEAALTGESRPVPKGVGDEVFTSTLNLHGSLLLRVTRIGRETLFSQIIFLVEQAQSTKVPIVEFSDRLSQIFVPIVLSLGAITFALWMFFYHGPYALIQAISHMVAVVVIACPCALSLAPGTAVAVSTGEAAKRGVLIKNVAVLETAHRLRHVVLDKTGTLTLGTPDVTHVVARSGVSVEPMMRWAASIESASGHPLGRAIVKHVEAQYGLLEPPKAVQAIAGRGIVGQVTGEEVLVGNTALMTDKEVVLNSDLVAQKSVFEQQGHTVMWVAASRQALGFVAVRDPLRPEALAVLEQLRQGGISVTMLTGDDIKTAQAIAGELGIEHVVANVLPQEKAQVVQQLQSRYGRVAMVGDGINDAPALVQADIGFAMGTGTDVANAAADVTLMSGRLDGIPFMVDLSRKVYRTIRQNFLYAFLFNGLGLPFAGFGLLGPELASASMGVSSFLVVGNSMRLKRRLQQEAEVLP